LFWHGYAVAKATAYKDCRDIDSAVGCAATISRNFTAELNSRAAALTLRNQTVKVWFKAEVEP
jgi:hypothetical protein